jgi:demethylspheroidene O-methyltransferase
LKPPVSGNCGPSDDDAMSSWPPALDVPAVPPSEPSTGWVARIEDRVLAWRDRRIADPGFRRRAAGSWWGGRIARRRAAELFDLVAGFVYSQVLLACVRLRVFELLADRPQTVEALAPRLGLDVQAARRLVAAGIAVKLLEHRRDERVGLGPLGAPMVGNTAVAAMVEHHAALYSDLRDPVALLQGKTRGEAPTSLAGYWPYATGSAGAGQMSPERVAEYSALMSASQSLVTDELLDAYDLRRHRCLLDVGGGEGRFLAAAARRAPHLKLMLFDLPPVVERAREQLGSQGLGERLQLTGGDFFADALPAGADLVSLIRVAFDHPDERVLTLLRAVRRALPAGGRLLLAEPMAATPGAEAMGDAYFGFYLFAMGQGRPRSAEELTALLRAAGFAAVRRLPTRMPLHTQLLVADA